MVLDSNELGQKLLRASGRQAGWRRWVKAVSDVRFCQQQRASAEGVH
jgi:hypothetical protein